MEAFRQKRVLERSARTDRIKKRLQDIKDQRQQSIANIKLQFGALDYGEVDNDQTTADKSRRNSKTPRKNRVKPSLSVRARQAAMQLKTAIKNIGKENPTVKKSSKNAKEYKILNFILLYIHIEPFSILLIFAYQPASELIGQLPVQYPLLNYSQALCAVTPW